MCEIKIYTGSLGTDYSMFLSFLILNRAFCLIPISEIKMAPVRMSQIFVRRLFFINSFLRYYQSVLVKWESDRDSLHYNKTYNEGKESDMSLCHTVLLIYFHNIRLIILLDCQPIRIIKRLFSHSYSYKYICHFSLTLQLRNVLKTLYWIFNSWFCIIRLKFQQRLLSSMNFGVSSVIENSH